MDRNISVPTRKERNQIFACLWVTYDVRVIGTWILFQAFVGPLKCPHDETLLIDFKAFHKKLFPDIH